MNKDLYSILNKCSSQEFDRLKASRKILLLKHCNNERKIQDLKYELFKISAKLLVKAINNFFKLTENFPKEKVIHTHSDIAQECWFIFDRCVQNIKIEDHKKYNFYLNTSLNRGIYRVFERNYKKHYDLVSSSDSNELSIASAKSVRNDFDLIELDLSLNFSEVEIDIINFKMSGEKLKVFLKQSNLSNMQFNVYMDAIKTKMVELYKTNHNIEDDGQHYYNE